MKNLYLLFLAAITCFNSFGQAPSIQWEKSYGGSNDEFAMSIQLTADSGFIIAGWTKSNDSEVSGNHGNRDYWIVKINGSGGIQWRKTLGGSLDDIGYSVHQTSDGGYIVAGASYSSDGDLTYNHGGSDIWIVKLNDTGDIQWQRSLGGSTDEWCYYAQQTLDGGYIVAGMSFSNDGDVSGNHGGEDNWIVKLDDTGAIQWQKCLGGSADDQCYSIQQLPDSSYILAGLSTSNDGQVSGNHGNWDCWIVKLSDTGTIQWQRSFGGTGADVAHSIQRTGDGGFIFAGSSSSNDGDVSGNHGSMDFWIVKLSDTGAIQWQKSLGGSNSDQGWSISQAEGDGYIASGQSWSNDGDVTVNHGNSDYWVLKINDTGAVLWQKSLGGTGMDQAWPIHQISGDEYITCGGSNSYDGDVTGNHGALDYWVVKLHCGLHAGVITGLSSLCMTDTLTLTDTASGGIWSVSNSHATVAGGTVTGITPGIDTVFYTVTTTCGSAVTSFTITVNSCPTENNIIAPAIVTVYPNPTNGIIDITGTMNATTKIYTLLGQQIKEARNTNNISITEFPTGMYFVRVFDEQGALLKQEKIIKE